MSATVLRTGVQKFSVQQIFADVHPVFGVRLAAGSAGSSRSSAPALNPFPITEPLTVNPATESISALKAFDQPLDPAEAVDVRTIHFSVPLVAQRLHAWINHIASGNSCS